MNSNSCNKNYIGQNINFNKRFKNHISALLHGVPG